MGSFDEWRRRLAQVMEQRGDWPARSPWVRQAVDALARDRFAPERVWWWDGHAYIPVDRAVDPDRWAAEVYGDPDAAAVTQVTEGLPSSSLSCEAVVVDMLDSLLLEPGHGVLELGTGTGATPRCWGGGPGPGGSPAWRWTPSWPTGRGYDSARRGSTYVSRSPTAVTCRPPPYRTTV